ncbi:MAG: hypothetical protein KBG73_10400 [Candidatus Promineofilum sp.]|nr:hypothetical protein [Promineifilum sp.]
MTWNRSLRRMLTVVGVLMVALLVLGACTMGGGEATVEETAGDIPQIAVEMGDAGPSIAAEVPSGVVAFNLSAAPGALLARLNEGVTLEQLNEGLSQPDPTAAVALVSLLGGASNTTDGQLIVDLQAGQHVLVNFPEDGPPSAVPFTAGEPSGATAPTPDVTVDLVDFNFAIPAEIEAGPQVWQISNKGQQWHEMAIVKLSEGATVADVVAMLQSEEEPAGPPPFEEVAFWSPNSPGEIGYATWDLPAGEYTVICFLPDLAGDMTSHAAHGMVATLTVTE